MTKAIIVTGAGGVGKTTVSAGLGVAAARRGARTLVMTVDPARRLADALGLTEVGGEPTVNPDLPTLAAAMLDAESSWDDLARRHADPQVADRLATSDFFRAIARHFPASQSYAASEKMADQLESGDWDIVVVDTPPAAGGIDFFTAPTDLANLVGGRLFRWMTGGNLPGRSQLFNAMARPALKTVDVVLGSDLLERVTQFLFDLRTTYDGLAARAEDIDGHFNSAAVLVVTTADPAPVTEAGRFFEELPEYASSPSAVVFNRALPTWKSVPESDEASINLNRWAAESHRQAVVRNEFAARHDVALIALPWLATAPTDLESLASAVEALEDGFLTEELAQLGIEG